jgi:outer membrane protein assembly factor BamB
VTGGLVIVAVAGQLAAYDAETGAARWVGPDGGSSYSPPHLVTIDGVPQILLVTAAGLTSVESARGTVLWQHAWSADVGILQPALIPDGGVLFAVGAGSGIRRLAVAPRPGGWTVEARWTSRGLKP